MRGAIGRPNNFILSNVNKHNPFSLQSTSSFCSGSGRGRGRGRGRGVPIGSLPFNATPKSPTEPTTESKPESPLAGLGHSRGRPPAPPSPALPSFSSFIASVKSGTGRSRGTSESDPSQQSGAPPKPRTFTRTESAESSQPSEPSLPSSILSVLSSAGAGRGKPGVEKPSPPPGSAPDMKEENRHIKAPSRPQVAAAESAPARPKLSREEAVKQAVRILSRGQGEGGERDADFRAGGGRGRGRGRGRVRGRGRGRGRGEGRMFRRELEDKDEGFAAGLYLGDNADGEKLANKIGIENMNKLVEGFEEMSGSVLPSPMEDSYLDALDTNFKFEFEPEYLMEEFGTNPDIDEEPPIPLRDALEKMKPFLMSYEGIQSHEEWEEAINEVMERVPLLKEIVDHYSGPDRVTAKKQQEELERVAKTIPERAPPSLKRFANRAVLSLQSNPGWGFDKKCQFMDKLAWEASQHYK